MERQQAWGLISALPAALVLALGFALPLALVAAYSVMPPRTFALTGQPTLANYVELARGGYAVPLLWSLLLAAMTTLACLILSWPAAKALDHHAGRFASVVGILIALPIFISESVRLFGASLFLMPRGGILAGTLSSLFGLEIGSILYTKAATVLGLVYVHLPFTLFPAVLGLSQVPKDQVEAARDLGASPWQVFREVELPAALPGIVVGALLTFVLSLGSSAEAAILGGQAVTVVARAIEQRFTYAQDWPLGAALTVVVTLVAAAVVLPALHRVDLDRLLRR